MNIRQILSDLGLAKIFLYQVQKEQTINLKKNDIWTLSKWKNCALQTISLRRVKDTE